MANTIKLKQGSGSDPSASDLVLGEPAIRTDTGEIFLKKDDGSIAKVAGGIDDGDKGDITVSNDGATFTIDNGVINNAKIASNASMSLSKLEVITSNRIVGNDSGNAVPKELTAAEVRTIINVENGATADQSASEILTLLKTVDGAGSGLDADTLDGISSASFVRSDASDTLTGGTYTLNSSTAQKIILRGANDPYIRFQEGTTNKAYIQWNSGGYLELFNQESSESLRIKSGSSGLVFYEGGSEKTVYHTGNLSVGDGGLTSNNFTDSDHSKLNGIESGATADQSASEILTAIKTVDGASSGLDADMLDGLHAATFLRGDTADEASGDITFSGGAGAATIAANSDIRFTTGTWTGEHAGKIQHHQNIFYIQGGSSGIQLRGSDGGSMALFQNTSTILYDDVNFQGGAGAATIAANSDIRFTNGNWTGNSCKIQHHGNSLYIQGGSNSSYNIILRSNSGSDRLYMNAAGDLYPATAGATDLGLSSARFQVGYFDEVASYEVRVDNGILETKAAIATSHTLTADYNALAVSPTINNGVTVTVPSGAVWAIV